MWRREWWRRWRDPGVRRRTNFSSFIRRLIHSTIDSVDERDVRSTRHQLSSDQYPLCSSGFSNHHSCPRGVGGSSSSVIDMATSPHSFRITAVVGESAPP
mmetsp:Transcript_318/g.1233  ORF Transcript_318/g.1233 Transcript_318/m.1233 type:complete len:100 (-) Transcript_318:743-1042(-)